MSYNKMNYDCHYLTSWKDRKSKKVATNISYEYTMRFQSGDRQHDRMVEDKRKTLERALQYSYQRGFIQKVGNKQNKIVKALINPDKNKPDYDDKILSVMFDADFHPGDVFEWKNTKSYWLIYLEDLDELAYFRGSIRRCRYCIYWKDVEGIMRNSYAAIRGPVETKINYIQKSGISVDRPNYSLHILMPKNEHTLNYFVRYAKFYLQDADMPDRQTCWRIEATDSISTPGILEITAVEYYSNEFEDDVAQGIVNGLTPTKQELIEEKNVISDIIGDIFIKPKVEYEYEYIGDEDASWSLEPRKPVSIIREEGKKVVIKWDVTFSGQFDLSYGNCVKTIVVESLF